MSKNTHMEHIEDMMFNDGVDGARMAINSLRALRDMLAGNSTSRMNATVKWDGAPAVFAGIDPADGKFFVAKKGLFNVNPKMYKTQADINRELSGELRTKFTIALRELSKLGITSGVYQGDLLFTPGDVKVETINDEKFYTFHPNTIVYTVPVRSKLGAQIARAKMGIVWHTTYEGRTIQDMKASFGRGIVDKMTKVPTVFMDDATYKDVSGTATFTSRETQEVTSMLSAAGKQFNTISGNVLRLIRDDEELKQKIKTFNNQYVRRGEPFPDANRHVKELYEYINQWYQKEIDKKKTEKTKAEWAEKRDTVLKKVFANVTDLVNIFKLMNILIAVKQKIIDKMNRAGSIGTMLKTSNGFRVTSPEGYVAIDRQGNAVKLVDRLEFSRANFSPDVIKGWQK
jgi:hypothetical protein